MRSSPTRWVRSTLVHWAFAAPLLAVTSACDDASVALDPEMSDSVDPVDIKEATEGVDAAGVCSTLSGRTMAGATLTAEVVTATETAPIYCKVTGQLAPALNFQIVLPDDWNGKLHYSGGGGYNGSVPGVGGAILAALEHGYVTVASDSGHQGSGVDASFALDDTYAAQLFGSLSVPTVMSIALEVVTAAYGEPPSRSYFEGCSNGGREALMNVQRFPNLFDGVIARAPAYNWVGFMGAFNATAKALAAPGGAYTAAKTALLARLVREACDDLDGVVDGVVSNQAACSPEYYVPVSLRCPDGIDTGDTCLSDAQLAVVSTWTSDVVFSGSPTFRNTGWSLTGNEDDPGAWATWLTGNGTVTMAAQYLFQDTTVKNYLARDPNADSLAYTPWDQNQNALYAVAALNDATATDLETFANSGAKLLLWHGGNDAALSKHSTAEYYENAVAAAGGQSAADDFMRFYIAPGVNHCAGGPGADSTDLLAALDAWVEEGMAPENLVAEKIDRTTGAVAFARPLCEYPEFPLYTGPANDPAATALATNYTCSR
jgi:hypothetical protein